METKRLVNSGAEVLLGHSFPVLDKGYIKLVDYMGTDEAIVAAARHSYGKELDLSDHEGNERLINFLMRERHTSPFEQPALVFEVKAPIFVFREWHRHRTAKLNEMSGRYTVMPQEYYVPSQERVRKQSKTNKQGSGDPMEPGHYEEWVQQYKRNIDRTFREYNWAVSVEDGDMGMAKEIARIGLPVSTYSKMVWQCDLHNLLHFLKLRMAPAAQWEIREYARLIGQMVEGSFPKVWKAFDQHVLNAVTLSKDEVAALSSLLSGYDVVSGAAARAIKKMQIHLDTKQNLM